MVITGITGVGKTYLACALAQQACRNGLRTLYKRSSRLFEDWRWRVPTARTLRERLSAR